MKTVPASALCVFLFFIVISPAYPDSPHPVGIRTDGTLSDIGKLDLKGPDYEIKAEFGKQAGVNLFHSFQQFNLHSRESATFTGPDSVKNIIARVTGGEASWIDGRLGSSIPNADLYFLNPAGIMFGPDASLDLSGSFHVSAADYLRMGTEERFYSLPHGDDLLSAAPPSAFGFLDSDTGDIRFEGRGEITETEWNRHPSGLQVSEGKTVSVIGGDIEMENGTYYRYQKADNNGEYADGSEYSVSSAETVSVGGITAPGGQVCMVSAGSEGEVILRTSGPDASSVGTKGKIILSGKSKIDVHGENSGQVDIQADTLSLTEGSVIGADTYGAGKGGTVVIEARDIALTRGGMIGTGTFGSGDGGTVFIKARETLTVSGTDQTDPPLLSGIFSDSNSNKPDAGDAGKIVIDAEKIILKDHAEFRGVTFGPGDGGTIRVNAPEITVAQGSKIRTCTFGSGQAGTVDILSENLTVTAEGIFPAGIFSNSLSDHPDAGNGGEISISSGGILIADHAGVSTFSRGGGNAGVINLFAENIRLRDRAIISSLSEAGGGSITLEAEKYIWLSDSEISNSIRYGADQTTGNFRMDSEFLILNRSLVRTGVQEGPGGDIHIHANFISSSGSTVDASGQLTIISPDTDVSKSLTLMPGNFVDAEKWSEKPCGQRSAEKTSRFFINGRDAVPLSYDDWQPSVPTWTDKK